MSHSLCANDPQFWHAKMWGQSSYLVILQHWLNTQIGPNAMNLSLSSVVVNVMICDTRSDDQSCDGSGDLSLTFSNVVCVCLHMFGHMSYFGNCI